MIRVYPLLLMIGCFLLARPVAAQESQIYLEKIKPLLRARCYACHGALKQESDLRLDTAKQMQAAGILKSGKLLDRVS